MADRTVSVRLRAQVGDFVAEMNLAAKAVDGFDKKVQASSRTVADAGERTEQSFSRAGQSTQKSASLMRNELGALIATATGLAPPVLAAGAAFGAFTAVAVPSVVKVVAAQKDLAASWSTLDSKQRATSVHMNTLIGQYKNLAASYEPQALGLFNGLLSTTSQVMASAKPLLDAGAAGVSRFTGRIEDFVTGGTMTQFMTFAAHQAPSAFDQLGTTFTQTGTLALNLVQDLAPMGMTLLTAANGGLRLLNMVEQIDPRLVEFGVAAMALRTPTNALATGWSNISSRLGRFSHEAKGASVAARRVGVATKALNAGLSAGPNLYVGAALAATYLTARWWSAKDALDKNVDAIRVENNAFGNNIAGHRMAAQAIGELSVGRTTYNAQVARSAKAARDEVKAGNVNINTFARVRRMRQEELDAVKNITAGQRELAQTYGVSATQANQLATAAGVDLSRSMDKSGHLTREAAAKIRQYVVAAKAASDPTRVIAQALDAAGNSGLQLKDRMAALDSAFNALAGPTIGAFDATTRAASAFDQLDAAMRKSHGSMSLQTDAGRAARGAFAQMVMSVEANIKAQYQLDSILYGASKAAQNMAQNVRNMVPVMLAEAGNSKQTQNAVLAYAKSHGIAANSVDDLYNKLGTTHGQFIANAMAMGMNRKEAERLWRAFQKLKPVKLKADDRDFLVKLRRAQGLKIDPKTGLFKGNNAHYFNKWLKSKGLRLDPKTGLFKGDNAHYYNKWFKANRLKIDPKTGRIKGDSAAFWRAVHSIPQVVATRTIQINLSKGYMHIPRGIGATKADGGIVRRADGGIERYANGGMRRDFPPHVVDRPTLLYGEPETGGEAYIPLGTQKRRRSLTLLGDVARLFGLALVRPMADGGILAMADGGTTGDLNLSEIMQQWSDTVKPASKSDVSGARKNRRTQLDQLRNAEAALRRARRSHDHGRIAAAERRVRKERDDLRESTKKLTDVEKRYKIARQPAAVKLGTALGLKIKNTGAFIRNLTTLADRGFGVLAQQLLAMGGPEAEKIAASAVKLSRAKLTKLQGQIQTSQAQQQTLENMPAILAVRGAIKKGGPAASSWVELLRATGLAPNVAAIAIKSMLADLSKTGPGRALIADMHAHGYAHGGQVAGQPGTDRTLIRATAGEYVTNKRSTSRHLPLLEAINADRGGDTLLRRRIAAVGTAPRSAIASASARGAVHVENHITMAAAPPAQVAREVARETAWVLN